MKAIKAFSRIYVLLVVLLNIAAFSVEPSRGLCLGGAAMGADLLFIVLAVNGLIKF